MFKKKIAVLAAAAMLTLTASSAFAAFSNLDLVRVVYNQSGGTTEIATELSGLVSAGGALTAGTFGGGADAFTAQAGGTNFSNLYVAYFAINRVGSTVKELWITGVDPVGQSGKGASIASLTTAIFTYYNSLPVTGSTVAAAADNSSSYRVKADQTNNFGSFGTFLTADTQAGTATSLVNLATSPVTQDLYYFANYGINAAGVKAGTVTTNANGSTTTALATPIPAAFYLMGSGLLGLVGMRRRNNA